MTPMRLSEIATAIGGELIGDDAVVSSVSTDSRTIQPGELFIAIRGDTFDGHDKLDEVFAKGAAGAIISSPPPLEGRLVCRGGGRGPEARIAVSAPSSAKQIPPTPSADSATPLRTPPPAPTDESALKGRGEILVADTRKALGLLALYARRQLKTTKVLAIAGSNGKTTTKNLLHAVLSTKLKGTASPKSFNNDIGVPATLLPVDPGDAYVIVEVGTNHPGEVEALSRISEPDAAVIVSIGEEHLEFFKDLDGVRTENAQITAGLRNDGPLIITGDDAKLRGVIGNRPFTTFGFNDGNDLRATNIHVTPTGTKFAFDKRDWHIPLIGAHFAACGLAVIALARWLGLSDEEIQIGFNTAQPSDMRMQPKQIGSITLLNDAYNANPTSMRAALKAANEIASPRRLVLILGDMAELGEMTDISHREIASEAKQLDALLITVGRAFEPYKSEMWFPDSTAAAGAVKQLLRPNDVVLLKGSRSMKLEKIAAAMEEAFA